MELLGVMQQITKHLETNKALLNDLDQQIGDGDHGTNIVRGFEAIISEPNKLQGVPLKVALNNCAMKLISQVGGSSGPLLGTCFMQMARVIEENDSVANWHKALQAGFEGIEMRGKSVVGEKTMLDALQPVLTTMASNSNDSWAELLPKMAQAALVGANNTKDMLATKGRASYLKERSIGHIDPGAQSMALIFQAIKVYYCG